MIRRMLVCGHGVQGPHGPTGRSAQERLQLFCTMALSSPSSSSATLCQQNPQGRNPESQEEPSAQSQYSAP